MKGITMFLSIGLMANLALAAPESVTKLTGVLVKPAYGSALYLEYPKEVVGACAEGQGVVITAVQYHDPKNNASMGADEGIKLTSGTTFVRLDGKPTLAEYFKKNGIEVKTGFTRRYSCAVPIFSKAQFEQVGQGGRVCQEERPGLPYFKASDNFLSSRYKHTVEGNIVFSNGGELCTVYQNYKGPYYLDSLNQGFQYYPQTAYEVFVGHCSYGSLVTDIGTPEAMDKICPESKFFEVAKKALNGTTGKAVFSIF